MPQADRRLLRIGCSGKHLSLLYERIEPLRPKLAAFLWQLPPNFPAGLDRLAATLDYLPRGERHAFEFRHASWFTDETYALLRAHNAALVVTDRPELTADFTYVRLGSWRRKLDVYAYFNNDWDGFAVRNAAGLRARLA